MNKIRLCLFYILSVLFICLLFAGCAQQYAPPEVSYAPASTALQSPVLPTKTPVMETSPSPSINSAVSVPTLLPSDNNHPTDEYTYKPSPSVTDDISQPPDDNPPDDYTDEPTPSPPPLSDTKIEFQCAKDIDGDGSDENIYVADRPVPSEPLIYDEYDLFVYVQDGDHINGTYIETSDWYSAAYYTTTKKGGSCLIVSLEGEDEDSSTFVFSLSDSSAVQTGELSGHVTEINGRQVKINDWGDALRSWAFYQMFELNNNCTLSAVTDKIITLGEEDDPLYTIKKLPVKMYEDGVYKKSYIQAHTYLYPVSTDLKSYLIFKLKDGSGGRIDYTCDGGEFLIDGNSADDYFDDLIFWN